MHEPTDARTGAQKLVGQHQRPFVDEEACPAYGGKAQETRAGQQAMNLFEDHGL
jgi:hypothetical protein